MSITQPPLQPRAAAEVESVKRQKIQAEAASKVETEGADVTEAKTFEMVTTSPVVDENGIAQVAMNVGHLSVAAHHGKAWSVVSLQNNTVNCCRLLGHVPSERL